jgi:hypothetical protein
LFNKKLPENNFKPSLLCAVLLTYMLELLGFCVLNMLGLVDKNMDATSQQQEPFSIYCQSKIIMN